MQYNVFDFLLAIIYIVVIYIIASYIAIIKKKANPDYKYYTAGLMAKIFGGIAVCLIYSFYYHGGDTTVYFESSKVLSNLITQSPGKYLSILLGNLSPENYSAFNANTGWPNYYNDTKAFAVIRLVSPFTFLGFKSFLSTTVLVAIFNYSGIWRLFRLFNEKFPGMRGQLAIAILFMPSLIFWGSGILKDSFTISAGGWLIYSYYRIFINRKKPLVYIITLILSSYILIAIKPYIFFSLFIGVAVWYVAEIINKIKGPFLKTVVSPIVFIIVWAVGSVMVMYFGSLIGGAYSDIDSLIEKAIVTQDDLKRSYYMGNSFDIGTINPTITGILSKYPQAVTAGLFRPFIWESKNPVMLLAGIENFALLLMVIYILIKIGPIKLIRITFGESLLLSSLVFSLTFGFSIGLSTSNFGSLVRYKIPLIPFFVAYLFVVLKKSRESTETSLD